MKLPFTDTDSPSDDSAATNTPPPPQNTAAGQSAKFPWGYPMFREAATQPAPGAPEPNQDPSLAWTVDDWLRWPPDLFALTSIVLRSTGAYRYVVSPELLRFGPELQGKDEDVRNEWFDWIFQEQSDRPREIERLLKPVFHEAMARDPANSASTLVRYLTDRFEGIIREREHPGLPGSPASPRQEGGPSARTAPSGAGELDPVGALLRLHALADQVCQGFGLPHGPVDRHQGVYLAANMLLERTGTLSRLPKEYGFVLPKLRTPQRGLTLRTLSLNLTYHSSEVDIRWRTIPWINQDQNNVNILAVPWPWHVEASSFRPCTYGEDAEPDPRYGFFEYRSDTRLDVEVVIDLYREARQEVKRVHVMVFPELAITRRDLAGLQAALEKEAQGDAPMIIAGLRGESAGGKATNQVVVSTYFSGQWYDILQHKHHRWMLDAAQIRQYSIAGALNVSRKWWEAIDIPRRTLTFLAPNDWLTVCPLICEDLAQLEPVSEVIRGVGPTLVIALLMDGPQLPQRWAARYVSVLADDPGTSVLSLTSLGMSRRSREGGGAAGERGRPQESRGVALWKDQESGAKVVELDANANAFLLTINAVRKVEFTADGRRDSGCGSFVFQGIRDIYGRRRERRGDEIPTPPEVRARGERDVEDLTVFSYFVDAVLDISPDPRKALSKQIDYRTPAAGAVRHLSEPFRTIWSRVHLSRKEAAERNPEFHKERVDGFSTAMDAFMEFMEKVDSPALAITAGAENDRHRQRIRRWVAIEGAAARQLMAITDKERRPATASESDRLRILRLSHLLVLWAVHNRAHQHMQTIAEDRHCEAERKELYHLLTRIEEDLGLYA